MKRKMLCIVGACIVLLVSCAVTKAPLIPNKLTPAVSSLSHHTEGINLTGKRVVAWVCVPLAYVTDASEVAALARARMILADWLSEKGTNKVDPRRFRESMEKKRHTISSLPYKVDLGSEGLMIKVWIVSQ